MKTLIVALLLALAPAAFAQDAPFDADPWPSSRSFGNSRYVPVTYAAPVESGEDMCERFAGSAVTRRVQEDGRYVCRVFSRPNRSEFRNFFFRARGENVPVVTAVNGNPSTYNPDSTASEYLIAHITRSLRWGRDSDLRHIRKCSRVYRRVASDTEGPFEILYIASVDRENNCDLSE